MSDDTSTHQKRVMRMQRARARALADQYLACRLVGHMWTRASTDRPAQFWRLLSWECGRCGCERDDHISIRGVVIARTYRHPDGYLLERPIGEKGERGRLVSAPVLRVELIERGDR